MSEADSKLIDVLEQILRDDYVDGEEEELSFKESQRVQRLIRDYLEIEDSPSDRDPYQIAYFIYWNCSSASQAAAERYLATLTEEKLGNLLLGDVLGLLQPGLEGDIEGLADENEEERRGERDG